MPRTKTLSDIDSSTVAEDATEEELLHRMQAIVEHVKSIERGIGGSRQPASRIELAQLADLGREYGRLRDRLERRLRLMPND